MNHSPEEACWNMDTTHSDRAVNKVCQACSGPLHFCFTQARCVDIACPLYWKGQGGIELLVPSQGYVPAIARAQTIILKPQDM